MKLYFLISFFFLFSKAIEKNNKLDLNSQEKITIKSILKKIQSEKMDISLFIHENTKEEAIILLYEYYKVKDVLDNSNNKRFINFRRFGLSRGKTVVNYFGKDKEDNFSINLEFEEQNNLDYSGYNYSFKFLKNYNPYINLVIRNKIKVGKKDGTDFYSTNIYLVKKYIEDKLIAYNFCKSKSINESKTFSYKIEFTQDEITFLAKKSNFQKLKTSLKKINLL